MTDKEKAKYEYKIEGLRRMCKRIKKRGNKKVSKLAIKKQLSYLDALLSDR